MKRLRIRTFLKNSCKDLKLDLLERVGFNEVEEQLFEELYLKKYVDSKEKICMKIGYSTTRYNDIHNNILDKIESYLEYIQK